MIWRVSLLASLCLILAVAGSDAQVIVGSVTDRETGSRLGGAFVVLLDERGERRAAVLADSAGRFLVRVPGAGRYVLHAERIGHETTASPLLELAADETLEHDLMIRSRPIRLAGIAIPGVARCQLAADAGAETHRLWEEARKALDVVAWVEARGGVPYQRGVYERKRDSRSMQILEHRGLLESGYGHAAFYSEAPEILAARGFVRVQDDGSHQYFGVDAQTLLSDPFLDTHCFRMTAAHPDDDALVGLAFEPLRGHPVPDIEGVLWLDRHTAELRYLEFAYTEHLHPLPVPTDLFGGRVDFRRLATGAWIVDRWRLRMPEFVGITPGQARERSDDWLSDRLLAGVPVDLVVREVGGELPFFPQVTVRPLQGDAAVEGVVYDSARDRPVVDAIVFLTGSRRVAASDANGRFRIEDVPAGVDHVAFFHPYADSLALPITPREVHLESGTTTPVELGIPRSQGCPPSVGLRARAGAIVGLVYDAHDGVPAAHARILSSWRGAGLLRRLTAERRTRVTADEEGRFILCDVPLGVRVRLRASSASADGPTTTLILERAAIVRQDLLVR